MAEQEEKSSVAALQLDEIKLEQADAPDIALLQWLTGAEKAISELEPDELSSHLPAFNSLSLRLSTAAPTPQKPTNLPKPGRPIRHALARCLVSYHLKVESRTLFDVMQGLLKFVNEKENAGKGKDGEWNLWRVASWYLIGEIMKNMGANNMSFMAEIALTVIKIVKASSTPVIIRTSALSALAKSLSTAGKAVPETVAKDLVKLLIGKNGLSDAAGPVQRCCAEVLVALSTHTYTISSLSDMDSIISVSIKSLEKADYNTRRGLSRLIAHLLAMTQSTAGPVAQDKKGKKAATDDNDAVTVVTSGADQTVKTMLSLHDMLKQLSIAFNRAASPRKTRNAIFDVYATLFESLGAGYVESHYGEIVSHLFEAVVLPHRSRSSKYEILAMREMMGLLLRDLVGTRLLSEQGQVMAVRELVGSYLQKWPVLLPGQQETNPLVLIVALKEVAGLLLQLGNATPSIQEVLQEPLLRLLAHPNDAVRIHTAWCLRIYCYTTPLTLPKMIVQILADLDRDMSLVGSPTSPPDLASRALGRAYALSALIAAVPDRPLYVSYDISTTVMDTAIGLLKRAGDHDIKVAEIEVHVAWTLIGSLMTLGASFVKMHLPQLLVLWRNALPKPTSKDSSVGERGEREWLFLLQVRECALSAILSFLRNNPSKDVVTLDVARRLAALLTNTLNFINGFASAYAEALRELQAAQMQQQQGGASAAHPATMTFASAAGRATLADRENLLRRRILQCFTALGSSSATESSQAALVMAAVGAIADPDNAVVSANATQAAIQASAGGFTNVWQSVDMYAFGVTSLRSARSTVVGAPDDLNRDSIEMAIELQLSNPLLASLEHDTLGLTVRAKADTSHDVCPTSVSAATGVIDAGVELFATLLPHQTVDTVMQSVTLMTNHLRSPKMERNPGRRQAVLYNILVALSRALSFAQAAGPRRTNAFSSANVVGVIRALLQEGILDSSKQLRASASEAMGSLASLVGGNYLNPQSQWLVDQIVSNRAPDSRAGCALGLAAIYSHVGGLLAAPLLKTIVSVLMSLSTDPHPTVHYYAMSSLAEVIDSASLAYSPYVTSTIKMVANIYMLETHEPEGGSVGSTNLRGDLPAYQEMCRILHAVIGVVGPELQEPSSMKTLVLLLVHEFGLEPDEGLAVEAMRCFQQILMFVPNDIDIPRLVTTFRSHLGSKRRPLKVAAITALYQIVQRDAVLMSKLGGNQLVEDLFALLDEDPSMEGVRQVIISWLQQTSAALPSGWIDLCQRIMNRPVNAGGPAAAAANAGGLQDDEGQSLGADSSALMAAVTSRWRTQLFALQCLHEVIQAVVRAGRPEHFDAALARSMNLNPRQLIFSRVSDLIRMAFSAATAQTMEVRMQGLVVLRDVVEHFSKSPDPDFDGALLLEQHQAPIAAALTPSFGQDSAPEVLASAINICAVFVGSGVVKEIARMGRILKLLTSALERCQAAGNMAAGSAEGLSANADIMLKVSALTAWAELQISSVRQPYLKAVIKPHQTLLNSLWVGALRDYSLLRTDPDSESVSSSGNMIHSRLGREILLPYYEKASVVILDAVAISMDGGDPSIKSAMDDKKPGEVMQDSKMPTLRPMPTANFFVVYGLSFELATQSVGNPAASASGVTALHAIRNIVDPVYCGTQLFDSPLFDELCTMCYRIALSESAALKKEMILIMGAFATSRRGSADDQQVRRALAVITFALRAAIPSRGLTSNLLPTDSAEDRAAFLNSSFTAFMSVVDCCEAAGRLELLLVAIQLYSDLLKDESSRVDVVGSTLPSLKNLLDKAHTHASSSLVFGRVVHSVLSSCIANLDDMRGRQGPVVMLKVKNNLLAIVLILTTLRPGVSISRAVNEEACYIIGQRMQEDNDLQVTAIQCAKALIMSAARGNAVLRPCIAQLFSDMIRYLAKVAESAETLDQRATLWSGGKEITQCLGQFVAGLEEGQKPGGYAVLLPTLILLLDPELKSNPVHDMAVSQLLELAVQAPVPFKEAAAALDESNRVRLETAIRQAVAVRQSGAKTTANVKPQISLKSFG